jgi:hypothetical protein
MENSALIGVSLFNVRVIVTIMRVLAVELLCQAVMGRILILTCLLPGARRRMWLCLVLSGIKWPHHSRSPTLGPLAWYLGYPRAWLPGARAHAELGCEVELV